MEYTPQESSVLALMNKTDFKNISKSDVLSIVSQLNELRPDVAKDIVAQFPQFAELLQSLATEYYSALKSIVASDDESLKQVYAIEEKGLNELADSKKQLFDLANKIFDDYRKCLEDPNLTHEQRMEIVDKETELFKVASEKVAECRKDEKEIIHSAEQKDSEKRQFNWGVLKAACSVLLLVGGTAAAALGVKIKLPKK